jgi:hypothetical protein
MGVMEDPPEPRSVKIGADERTGWSSERPRRADAPPRLPDISVRCRVLAPSFRMRYSPGSLLLIVGAAASDPAKFADRVIDERGAVLAPARVRALLAGKVPDDQIESRAAELLAAAAQKRLSAKQTVVIPVEGFDAAERERYVRLAHRLGRPRHIILVEAPRDRVTDEERKPLDDLRRALDAGELGAEGFQTALRLGGQALSELKKIIFAPPPRDD